MEIGDDRSDEYRWRNEWVIDTTTTTTTTTVNLV